MTNRRTLFEINNFKSHTNISPDVVSRRLVYLFVRDLLSGLGFVGDLLDYYDARMGDFDLGNLSVYRESYGVYLFGGEVSTVVSVISGCASFVQSEVESFVRSWKVLSTLLLLAAHAYMGYFVYVFLAEQPYEEKLGFFKTFILWVGFKVVLGGLLGGVMFYFVVPSVVQPEVEKVCNFVLKSMNQSHVESMQDLDMPMAKRARRVWISNFSDMFESNGMNESQTSIYHHKYQGLQNMRHGIDSTSYFFVSTKLASCFPHLFVSKMILNFRSRFPPGSNFMLSIDDPYNSIEALYFSQKFSWNHYFNHGKYLIMSEIKSISSGFSISAFRSIIHLWNYFLCLSKFSQDLLFEFVLVVLLVGVLYLHVTLYEVMWYLVLIPIPVFFFLFWVDFAVWKVFEIKSSNKVVPMNNQQVIGASSAKPEELL